MRTQKESPPDEAGGVATALAGAASGRIENNHTPLCDDCQPASRNPQLSSEAAARLHALATFMDIPQAEIVNALILAADRQLVNVALRMSPRAVASGWRPRRFVPVQFIVAGEEVGE